jgi:hypothetical protein
MTTQHVQQQERKKERTASMTETPQVNAKRKIAGWTSMLLFLKPLTSEILQQNSLIFLNKDPRNSIEQVPLL